MVDAFVAGTTTVRGNFICGLNTNVSEVITCTGDEFEIMGNTTIGGSVTVASEIFTQTGTPLVIPVVISSRTSGGEPGETQSSDSRRRGTTESVTAYAIIGALVVGVTMVL